MKFRHKDYSKYAWPSRLTAPVIKVDLVIQCRRLPKKNLLSQADAFCVLWSAPSGYVPASDKNGMPNKLPGRQETELGRTDVERACVDPTFTWEGVRALRLSYSFQQEQSFVIRVYDEDLRYATDLKEHDYLGGCVFTLGSLMGAKGCTLAKKLGQGKAFMIITGEGMCFYPFICLFVRYVEHYTLFHFQNGSITTANFFLFDLFFVFF